MARLIEQWREHCRCRHGCPTSATIRKWDCGCVQVFVHDDRRRGYDCTDFSRLRRHCGRRGDPRDC